VNGPSTPPNETSTMCEGLLLESAEGVGVCDEGSACRALGLKPDYAAYRAAHDRVVTEAQNANKVEYGGEA
jgi:hypothetical protein